MPVNHFFETTAYPPIVDYALIGDCRSAALVSRDGSLDWLCWPRFDSPAFFAALLDADHGGRFQIRPTGQYRVERRYLPDTNVLETVFHAPGGVLALRDLMPVASEEEKPAGLLPEHEVLREVQGLAGEVAVFADRGDLAQAERRMLGLQLDDGLANPQRQGAPIRRRRVVGLEQAAHPRGGEAGDLAAQGPLGDAGLAGAGAHWLPEEHQGPQ